MTKTQKVILWTAIALILIGGGIFAYFYFRKPKIELSDPESGSVTAKLTASLYSVELTQGATGAAQRIEKGKFIFEAKSEAAKIVFSIYKDGALVASASISSLVYVNTGNVATSVTNEANK